MTFEREYRWATDRHRASPGRDTDPGEELAPRTPGKCTEVERALGRQAWWDGPAPAPGRRTLTEGLPPAPPSLDPPAHRVQRRTVRDVPAELGADPARVHAGPSPLVARWLAGLRRHRGLAPVRADRVPAPVPAVTDSVDAAMRAPAGPLPHRSRLELAFGHPLGMVRAHRGPGVAAALEPAGAAAAHRGLDVAFADAEPDLETVAHEVAHVMQNPSGAGAGVAAEGDRAELEAHAAAARALNGAPGEAARGLGPSPSAVHLLRLRKETKKKTSRWVCVDDKPAAEGDFNPERASDERLLEVLGELLVAEDYGLVVQVFAAVPQDRWHRIRTAQGQGNVIQVIGMFLDYPSEVPQINLIELDDGEGLALGTSLTTFRTWCAKFDEKIEEWGHKPRRVSIEGRRQLFVLHPEPLRGALAYRRARLALIGPLNRFGVAIQATDPTLVQVLDLCMRGHSARMNRVVLFEDAEPIALEICRQLLVLLSLQTYDTENGFSDLCGAIRIELGREEEYQKWAPGPFLALLDESLALAPLPPGGKLDVGHDGKRHRTYPLFALPNPACTQFLGDRTVGPGGSFGFVCNVPTIANGKDKAPIDIANQYARQALATGGGHSHALVIGLNERMPDTPEEQEQRRVAMGRLATQIFGFAAFPVIVIGFFWQSDERPCPYGLIRDTLKDHPVTRTLVAHMRTRHPERVYLHVGDSDPETLQVDGRNLFDRQASFLQRQRQGGHNPDVIGGAYGFDMHEDLRHARAVHTLPELYAMCMSMLLRDVGASVNPMFPYFAEANLLIKATDENLDTSFGVPKKEGQTYLNNLKTSLAERDPDVKSGEPYALQQHFAFDFDLRVVTDARRQANAFRGLWGTLTRETLARLYLEDYRELRTKLLTHLGLPRQVSRQVLALVLLQQPELLLELAVSCGVTTEKSALLDHIKNSHNQLAQCTATTQQYCNRMISAFGMSSNDQKFSNIVQALLFGHRICEYDPVLLGIVLALDPEAEHGHGPHTLNAFAYGLLTSAILELSKITNQDVAAHDSRNAPEGYDIDGQRTGSLNTRLTTQRRALNNAIKSLRNALLGLVPDEDDLDDGATPLTEEQDLVRKEVLRKLTLLDNQVNDPRSHPIPQIAVAGTRFVKGCTELLKDLRILLKVFARDKREVPDKLGELCEQIEGLVEKIEKLGNEAKGETGDAWRVRSLIVLERLIAWVPEGIRATPMGKQMISKAVEAARHLFAGKSKDRTMAQHLLRMLDVISLIKNTSHLHDTMLVGLLTGVSDPMQHADLERRKLKAIGGVRSTLLRLFHRLAKTQPEGPRRDEFLLQCVGQMLGTVETLPYATAASLAACRDKIGRGVFEIAKYLTTQQEGELVAAAWMTVAGQLDALLQILQEMDGVEVEDGVGAGTSGPPTMQPASPQPEPKKPIPKRKKMVIYSDDEEEQVETKSPGKEKQERTFDEGTQLSEEEQMRIAIERSLSDPRDGSDGGMY
jgi:hypothetical protein